MRYAFRCGLKIRLERGTLIASSGTGDCGGQKLREARGYLQPRDGWGRRILWPVLQAVIRSRDGPGCGTRVRDKGSFRRASRILSLKRSTWSRRTPPVQVRPRQVQHRLAGRVSCHATLCPQHLPGSRLRSVLPIVAVDHSRPAAPFDAALSFRATRWAEITVGRDRGVGHRDEALARDIINPVQPLKPQPSRRPRHARKRALARASIGIGALVAGLSVCFAAKDG